MISKEQIKLIDKIITAEMIRDKTPGLCLGIVKDNELIYSSSFGAKDLIKQEPVTTDTLFILASVTKNFIAMGILKLYELKKLDLTDPITKYLPLDDFEKFENTKRITIHHLLSHSSGIPNIADGLNINQLSVDYNLGFSAPSIPLASWDDVFRLTNSVAEFITDEPGSKFYYNNLGYSLLVKIIENVSNMSVSEFLKKNIFEPLEMPETDFATSLMVQNEKLTKFYIDNKDKKQINIESNKNDRGDIWFGPGGLISSVNQLAKYMIMLFNKGVYKGKRIASEENISLAFTQHFIEQFPYEEFYNFYGNYGQTGYGYGFVIQNDFVGKKLVHHSGSSLGASTWFAMIPEEKLGVIVLCNKHPSPRMFAHAILMIVLGVDPYEHFPILKIRKMYRPLEGKYETFNGLNKVQVENIGNVLVMTSSMTEQKIQLIPNFEFTLGRKIFPFYIQSPIGGNTPIVFEIKDDNTIILNIERDHFIKKSLL